MNRVTIPRGIGWARDGGGGICRNQHHAPFGIGLVGERTARRGNCSTVSALIAIPVLVYSGRIFFQSAWSALQAGRTNTDVPISLDIVLAAALSLFETARGAVTEAVEVAQAARRLAHQNLVLAAAYNLIVFPVALVGYVTMLLAAIAMSSSSILVVANAMRIARSRRAPAGARQGAARPVPLAVPS